MNYPYEDARRIELLIDNQIQRILQSVVFEPNNQHTWQTVTALVNQALTDVWQEGGLQGATAAQAFQVLCGLGTSMVEQDLSSGRLKVITKVAVIHPEEYVVLENQVAMATSS